jgi:hypothetical protein
MSAPKKTSASFLDNRVPYSSKEISYSSQMKPYSNDVPYSIERRLVLLEVAQEAHTGQVDLGDFCSRPTGYVAEILDFLDAFIQGKLRFRWPLRHGRLPRTVRRLRERQTLLFRGWSAGGANHICWRTLESRGHCGEGRAGREMSFHPAETVNAGQTRREPKRGRVVAAPKLHRRKHRKTRPLLTERLLAFEAWSQVEDKRERGFLIFSFIQNRRRSYPKFRCRFGSNKR